MMISEDREDKEVKKVATVGFFDGVHKGHQYLLKRVRERAAAEGLASAVITFDVHPRQVVQPHYQPQLLTTLDEKLQLIADAGIDHCMVLHFDERMAAMSAPDFMRQILRSQYHVCRLLMGYDHRFGHDGSATFADYVRYGEALGMAVEHADVVDVEGGHVSSSRIRATLQSGAVDEAARYLGRPYALSGTVVGGERQGRKMGFPTANLSPSSHCKVIPAQGVYAVQVSIDGADHWLPAMMNIGRRPTFHGDRVTIEVHILHFQGDLYGRQLHVAFHSRLRAEQPFASPAALAGQLRKDLEAVKEYYALL